LHSVGDVITGGLDTPQNIFLIRQVHGDALTRRTYDLIYREVLTPYDDRLVRGFGEGLGRYSSKARRIFSHGNISDQVKTVLI